MKKNIAILASALALISVFFTSCGEKKSNTVKLGVVGAMYEEIWKPAKEALKTEGVISGGMIPKIDCCIDAIQKGVHNVIIMDGRVPHSILTELLTDEGAGTMIKGRL